MVTQSLPRTRTIHPGETLSAMLGEHRITQFRLAQAIGVPPRRISEIVRAIVLSC